MQREFSNTAGGTISSPRKVIFLCLAVMVITFAVYMQTRSHTFFILDGNDHITENVHVESGLTAGNLAWAFTSLEAFNWHPVTWLSHMAIAEFFGMEPGAHHLGNVGIHAAASAILFLLFLRLTGATWQSLFVAALFALHPLHVESVAWVAERKDVLSAFFGFLTLYCYSGYAARQWNSTLYALSLIFFVLGLMSKSMLVTLPVVMLLMDFWPLDRYREGESGPRLLSRRVLAIAREKLPFFACSLITGVITIYAQHTGGATKTFDAVPFMLRIENSLVSYLKYIFKTLWPVNLGVLYPMPSSLPLWQVAGSLLILIAITVCVIRYGSRFPYLPVGWFWFLVTLVPVIGLIQVGSQAMADRYTYIPAVGLFIIAAWGGTDLTRRMPYRKVIMALMAGGVIIASTMLTWRQVGYWRDSTAILRHTLDVTSGNYLVHDLLGLTFAKNGDLDAALQEYRKAVQIEPRDAKVRTNLAIVLSAQGDLDAAIREFNVALGMKPGDARIHSLLGDALEEKGDPEAAIRAYQEALRLNPGYRPAQTGLAAVSGQKKRQDAGGDWLHVR